jgi:thioredoxin 1
VKFGKILACAAAVAAIQTAVWAQSSATTAKHSSTTKSAVASTPSAFAPLDQWKAAVIAGDVNALKALYTTDPPSQSRSPMGTSSDPSEEPVFWASLAEQGLHGFNPKILEIQHPQQGVTVLLMRIEYNLGKGAGTPVYAATSQAWINQNGWKIVQTSRNEARPSPQRRIPEPAKINTDLYASPQESRTEIVEALAKAKAEHKRVILMFGGNWCIDCHVLDAAMHTKTVAPLLNANYILVHVNIGESGDENLDIAAKYETPVADGVPALAVLNPDGTLVFSQKQGEFKTSYRIGPEDVVNFLEKWKPTKG